MSYDFTVPGQLSLENGKGKQAGLEIKLKLKYTVQIQQTMISYYWNEYQYYVPLVPHWVISLPGNSHSGKGLARGTAQVY